MGPAFTCASRQSGEMRHVLNFRNFKSLTTCAGLIQLYSFFGDALVVSHLCAVSLVLLGGGNINSWSWECTTYCGANNSLQHTLQVDFVRWRTLQCLRQLCQLAAQLFDGHLDGSQVEVLLFDDCNAFLDIRKCV